MVGNHSKAAEKEFSGAFYKVIVHSNQWQDLVTDDQDQREYLGLSKFIRRNKV
jgi:hypothetical protein